MDGVIYVARRSLKGSAKFLWSAIEVASDQNDRRVDVEGKSKDQLAIAGQSPIYDPPRPKEERPHHLDR